MSHFLFIRNEPSIPNALREAFSAPENRIITRESAAQAQSALSRGAFDAVVLYAEGDLSETKRSLQEIRELSADVFVVVLAPQYDLEIEQASFDSGADLYFSEPVPSRTLSRVLQNSASPSTFSQSTHASAPDNPVEGQKNQTTSSTLHVFRDLSNILSFSLDYKAFTQHFILKLRDHLSFTRIGIFLESSAKQSLVHNTRSKHLNCIASLGLPSDLVECFQLSREVGIGRELYEQPRILQNNRHTKLPFSHEAGSINKEFDILGCQLAIPITDREDTIGLAVISGPVTGRNYSEDELQLLYLLMEELGMAIRNSRLHSELAQHGQLIENVMHSMASGAIVLSEHLDVLYINDAAKRFLDISMSNPDRVIDFAELPPQLAGPAHEAVEKGKLPEPFQIPDPNKGKIYQVSIFPFTQEGELVLLPRPTMIILEDFTKIEASKESALSETKTEIISLIAERFAHEIRNSLVPLSTHAQLFDKKIDQPKFQQSLKSSMLKETARIKRFSEQMLYLAQSSQTGGTDIEVEETLKTAFTRAQSHLGNTDAELLIDNTAEHSRVHANPESMTYAFEELFLNSIQAAPAEQKIQIQISQNQEGILLIRWKDSGEGFSEEDSQNAKEPFFTTRNTGVGLGLSVSDKVITEHQGYLRLNTRSENQDWDFEIELPSLLAQVSE